MYDLELLRKFCIVAKYQSFTKAAEELYISQPALSKSIKLLESQLDIELFTRNKKNISLTKEGSILYSLIYPKIDYLCNIDSFIENLKSDENYKLKIGCSSTITRNILTPVLKGFLEAHKNVDLSIINRSTNDLITSLRNNDVDLLIINLPVKDINGLCVTELMEIQDVFIAGDKYKYLKDQTVDIAQLQSFPIITNRQNSVTRENFEKYCLENNVSIKPHIEAVRNSLIIDFCSLGLGISFTNYDLMKKEIKENNLFVLNVEPSIPKRSIGIITRNQPNNSLIVSLINMLKEYTKKK